jgi:hypothetical protein
MVLAGGGLIPDNTAQWLAAVAVLVSAVNIGGGFTITQVRGRRGGASRAAGAPQPDACALAASRPRRPARRLLPDSPG